MENKYYTPNIEEFCVGFEYEFKWKPNKSEWKALKNRHPEDLIESIENEYNKEYRVKYLDKEDIESLTTVNAQGYFSIDKVIISLSDNQFVLIESYKEESDGKVLFQGIIKNKLEFKKVLFQLKIM